MPRKKMPWGLSRQIFLEKRYLHFGTIKYQSTSFYTEANGNNLSVEAMRRRNEVCSFPGP